MTQSSATMQDLWQGIPVGSFLMTQEHVPRFIAVNGSALALYGYESEDGLKDFPVTAVFDDPLDLAQIFVALQSGEKVRNRICRHRRKDGTVVWVSVSANRITAENGEPFCSVIVQDATEQKRQENQFQLGKQEWETVFDTMTELTILTDTSRRIIHCNRATAERLGKSYRDIVGQDILTLFFGADYPENDPFAEGNREVHIPALSAFFLAANNPIRHVFSVRGMVHVLMDITEMRKAEALMRKQEALYRSMAEGLPIGVYIAQDGCFQWVNERFCLNTGYSADDVLGRPCLSFVHPNDRSSVKENAIAMLNGFTSLPYGYRFHAKDGSTTWNMETVVSMHYNGRRAVLGGQMDITDRKRAEEAVRASEDRYRSIVDTIADAYYEVDLDGNAQRFNDAYLTLFERSREEMQGLNYRDYVGKEKMREIFQIFKSVYRTGIPIKSLEWDVLTKSGQWKTVEISVSLIRDKEGKPAGFRGILRDISERKRIAEALQQSEERYRTIIDTIPDGYFEMDLAGSNTFCNDQYLELRGCSREEIRNVNYKDYLDKKNAERAYKACNEVYRTGKPVKYLQLEWATRDGKRKIVSNSLSLIRDSKGAPMGFRGICRDITLQRQNEIHELHSQKLESVGQLAAGIAHEINTPIQFVGDNIHFMRDAFQDILSFASVLDVFPQMDPSDPSAVRALVGEIQEKEKEVELAYLREEIPKAINQSLDGLQRVSKIVQAMREFSHPGGEDMSEMDVNKAIESTVTLTRNEWKYASDMTVSLAPDLPMVKGYPADFNQVVLNIIVNAAQSIQEKTAQGGSEKGKISISTRQDGHEVEICIRDTGAGIPPEIQSRIFDPFFTTKAVGKGTGQGLAIAQNIIVRKHGGKLFFETKAGEGTAFYIRLPLGEG